MTQLSKLTNRQEAFCHEYLIDLNATQAAIRAGYSSKTAAEQGSRLMATPAVHNRVLQLQAERNRRVQIDADFVLTSAVEIFERCMQNVRPKTNRKGELLTDDDGNTVFEFDVSNSLKALELIGKHININAFRNNVELNQNSPAKFQIEVNNPQTKNDLLQLQERLKHD